MELSTPSISVIIIVKNGADCIEKCLSSVMFAHEIIVLDSGSTDNTVEICRRYTNHVFSTDWPGYGIQRGRALAKATSDWIFSIDHDEWVSEELKSEILKTIQNPTANVYKMPRHTQYLGQWIRFGDIGKDEVVRLFKRGTATFNDDIVHEGMIINTPIHALKSPLFHHSYRSYEDILQRMNLYTTLTAQKRFEQHKKSSFSRAVFGGLWAFLKAYILRFGFLDGKMGFMVAVTSAESSYYRHLKLLRLMESMAEKTKSGVSNCIQS